MTSQNNDLDWFSKIYGGMEHPIYASRYYTAEEAPFDNPGWSIEIPTRNILQREEHHIYLICQKNSDSDNYYYFIIPASFLKEHLDLLSVARKNKEECISLFISSATENRFQDEKGNGKIDFHVFLQSQSPLDAITGGKNTLH